MEEHLKAGTDDELVEAAQMGNPAAWERLVERYLRIVYAICYARLRRHEAAEDLVQEVFLCVFLKLGQLKNPKVFGPWVCRIARNAALDWLDKGWRRSKLVTMVSLDEKAERLLAEKAKGEAQHMEERVQHEAVRAAVFRLSVEQREMVLMRYIEGISAEEIAHRTGMSARTVLRHLNKAVAQLKASVESLLADAAPAIRASGSTTIRTLAVLGAASALSASAKSAMASSATASLAEQCLATLSAPASFSTKVLALLKDSPLIAGGKIMAIAKSAVAIVTAAALVVGITAYSQEKKEVAHQNVVLKEAKQAYGKMDSSVLKGIEVAIRAYKVDNAGNPPASFRNLTTPIAYLTGPWEKSRTLTQSEVKRWEAMPRWARDPYTGGQGSYRLWQSLSKPEQDEWIGYLAKQWSEMYLNEPRLTPDERRQIMAFGDDFAEKMKVLVPSLVARKAPKNEFDSEVLKLWDSCIQSKMKPIHAAVRDRARRPNPPK